MHLVNGDPNSLTGPTGFGAAGYIAPTQTLPYTINFANEPTADIPVQQVAVTELLDPNLDWTTFQVGDFSIGGTTYTVPANNGFYSTKIPLTLPANQESNGPVTIELDVTAGINLTTGLATWTFTSIDPTTGDLPADIFTGFLPPDQPSKNPPPGEASVNYTVRPKASAPAGSVIRSVAVIAFLGKAPLPTNLVDDHDPSKGTDPAKEAPLTIEDVPAAFVISL